ncbi:hypothetical protein ABC270_07245 [Curtobacterium sp. 1P10AnD]|uniref:hypothetical protein n=1 Tax=Curtobacterium sp. 1P10AnD TaxID=3132283 RepID=UPI0039A0D508
MSSSDAQPPLSRRQARERERAAAAGGQPVTPPPTVAAPTSTDGSEQARRRPGSHVAPAPAGAAQAGVPDVPPASATEIVPGTGGLTRRQLRLMREAEVQAVLPVPLRNPTPQSSDRTVQDVIGSVSTLEDDQAVSADSSPVASSPSRDGSEPSADPADAAEAPAALDEAVVHQATEADGSPDAVEPLEEAAAHAEEPRRHRSTWAPHDADAAVAPADDTAPTTGTEPAADAAETPSAPIAPKLPPVDAATPGVFPLSLDGDTNETPVQRPAADPATSSGVPAAFQRPVEPKPVTTAFQPPTGHWSALAHDSNDAEVHDEETGTRRVAASNPNAIVLPNSALADPTGALNATGEVILTGSIDLPASLSSTGSHRPIDGAEVDRLLEQHDEQPETDASPIRASRAVSSHTSTRQVVLAAAKPKESKTPMVLAVSVGAVGVAAAAVIIVALLTTHPFG